MLSGHGSLVLISGEAGIGKTALVDWLVGQAEQRGCLVLRGGCYDLSVTPPYGPWVEILDRYRSLEGAWPRVPQFIDNQTEPDRPGSQSVLFAAASEFFSAVAAECAVVLVLDGMHWADRASIDLLRVLARQTGQQRVLLLVTYRSDELSRDDYLYAILPLLVREAGAVRVDLRGLSEAGNRALIQSRYDLPAADLDRLADHLEVHAEGNPLYAGELLRTYEDEGVLVRSAATWTLGELDRVRVPSLLLQVIERRLRRLNEETRTYLQIAAVLGQDVSLELWLRVSGANDDALAGAVAEGVAAQLIDELAYAPGYGFKHSLVRQALYEEISGFQRRLRHRQAAETLEELPRPDPDAVAFHYQQAGDLRSIEWLIEAGMRAERSYAWVTAVHRFEAALKLMNDNGVNPSRRAVVAYRIANLQRYTDPQQTLALLRDARSLAIDGGDVGLASYCLFAMGMMQCVQQGLLQGLATMERAIDELRRVSDLDRIRVLSLPHADPGPPEGHLSAWLANSGRLLDALAVGERTMTELPPADSAEGQRGSSPAIVWYGIAIARSMLGHTDLARNAFRQAREAYLAIEHHAACAMVCGDELGYLQIPYFPDARERTALLVAQGEQAIRRASGVVAGSVAPQYADLDVLIVEGAWQRARQVAESAYAQPYWPVWLLGVRCLAILARLQGDVDLAKHLIGQVLPDGPATEPGNTFLMIGLQFQRLSADMALDAGDLPAARTWLEAHDRWMAWSGAILGQADGALLWGRYHHAAGDRQYAGERAQQAFSHASEPRQPLTLTAVLRLMAQLDIEERRFADAEERLSQSLAIAGSCAAPFERALTLLTQVELRASQRRMEDAAELLADAREIFEALGAKPALAKAVDLAIRLNVGTPQPHAASLPGGLTKREAEVLQLVARGLSNREIADELYISERTAEHHVSNILSKLNLTSRAQLAAFAVQQSLSTAPENS